MTSRLRVAIAGAGRGIGAACARAFAAEGARLALCARTASELEPLASQLDAGYVCADLATDEGAQRFADHAFATLGEVDVALVCVGVGHRRLALRDASRALFLQQLEQNALAPALAAAALLRGWTARPAGGDRQLLFLSSLVTRRPPLPGTGPYTASKAALEAVVRAFAEEAWPLVRANALCLPAVATRLHELAGTAPELIAQMPSPEQIAPLVLLVTGPLAQGLTGRAIDLELLVADPGAALRGDGRLAVVQPLQPALPAEGAAPPEGEPGRRPSPRVRRSVREAASALQRYPDAGARLANRLAALHGADPGCVALSGGGASELLERTLRAFCSPGDEVLSPFPTFELLSALCSRLGLRHRPVPSPRRPDGLFAPHSAEALLAAVGPRTRVVYVASPDNPTGALLQDRQEAELRARLPLSVLLLVDEAWGGAPAPAPLGVGTLRLRSFSKLHGLAALRIGYAVGAAELVSLLLRLQLPYPLGAPQLSAAEAVLDEPERSRRAGLLLSRERARLSQALRSLGLVVSEGDAAFLLIRDPSGRSAGRLLFALQAVGATAQEAHWDSSALVLALGTRAENRRHLAAVSRALTL